MHFEGLADFRPPEREEVEDRARDKNWEVFSVSREYNQGLDETSREKTRSLQHQRSGREKDPAKDTKKKWPLSEEKT